MRIRAYKYSLPLRNPIRITPQESIDRREGFLIRIDCEGLTGWGDVAPLDGYSDESVRDVEKCLSVCLSEIGPEGLPTPSPYPSLNAGVNFALLELQRPQEQKDCSVETAALLSMEDPAHVVTEVQRALKLGHKCLKIKVGRRSIDEDIETIRTINGLITDDVRLRLDANRAWSLKDALAFMSGIDGTCVSFIEEPLNDDQYQSFDQETPIPYAFDESLRWRKAVDAEKLKKLGALVLKPSLLGPEKVSTWTSFAEEKKIPCIISAMYESGVGIRALTNMAAGSPYHKSPAGLDTYSALADDLITPSITCVNGKMLYSATEPFSIASEKLEQVYDSD